MKDRQGLFFARHIEEKLGARLPACWDKNARGIQLVEPVGIAWCMPCMFLLSSNLAHTACLGRGGGGA
jgi:hypothetical protein